MSICERCRQEAEEVLTCPECEMSLGTDCCYTAGRGCLCNECELAEEEAGDADEE